MLGDMLAAGRGVKADPAAARGWYERAAANGFAAARERLAPPEAAQATA